MKSPIPKLGRTKIVLILTVAATILSVLLALFFLKLFGHNSNPVDVITRAAFVALLITPSFAWYFVGVLIKLNTLEEQIHTLNSLDPLTGLMNRRAFFDSADVSFDIALKEKKRCSMLAIDLDHFKQINDEHGHTAGDKVLRAVAKVILENIDREDIAGRLAGKEFVIFLPNTDLQNAIEFGQFLHREISSTPISHNKNFLNCTISLGISSSSQLKTHCLEELIVLADEMLNQAKEAGKNCTAAMGKIYSSSSESKSAEMAASESKPHTNMYLEHA